MCGMVEHPESELPAGDDVIIWHLQERDGLDVYRLTKGPTTIGEFTGRIIVVRVSGSAQARRIRAGCLAEGRVVSASPEPIHPFK